MGCTPILIQYNCVTLLRHSFTQDAVGGWGGTAISYVNILIKTGAISDLIRFHIFNCHESYFASSFLFYFTKERKIFSHMHLT